MLLCIVLDIVHYELCQRCCYQGGSDAVSLRLAQEYIEAFGKLAKETNTMLLPTNAGDPARYGTPP